MISVRKRDEVGIPKVTFGKKSKPKLKERTFLSGSI